MRIERSRREYLDPVPHGPMRRALLRPRLVVGVYGGPRRADGAPLRRRRARGAGESCSLPRNIEVDDDDVLALPPDLYNMQDVVDLDRLAERYAERQGRRPYRWVRFDVGPVEGVTHTEVMYLGDEPVPVVEIERAQS